MNRAILPGRRSSFKDPLGTAFALALSGLITGRAMRLTILTYVEKDHDRSYDAVVPQVARALRRGGHRVSILGAHGDVRRVVNGLSRRRPDLVFNLMEMFGDNVCGDVAVTGLLELMGLPFTGGGPGELYLRQDKALAKKVLAYEGIPYPRFAVFSKDADFETGGNLRMPLFVKPLRTDASIGIDHEALVHDAPHLIERVAEIHHRIHDSALAEEYIEGREFYVGVLGNRDPVALPPLEMDFSGLGGDVPHVLDAKAK